MPEEDKQASSTFVIRLVLYKTMNIAVLDENNIVVNIITCDDSKWIEDFSNPEHQMTAEECACNCMASIFPEGTKLVSAEPEFHERIARIGSYFDEDLDVFINPQPFPSWTLDPENHVWRAPVEHPKLIALHDPDDEIKGLEYESDIEKYYWDEDQLNWVEYATE